MAARRSQRGRRAVRERKERAEARRQSNLTIVGERKKVFRRSRKHPDGERKTEIVRRVLDHHTAAIAARHNAYDRRQQLYAKYRGWLGGDPNFPWPGASDVDIPDMRTAAFDVQDGLHNATLSGRPVVVAEALSEANAPQAQGIDDLIDYQVFREQEGEVWIGDAAEAFTVEGHVTLFTPWVREKLLLSVQADFPPVPAEVSPANYFNQLVRENFPEESEVWAHPTDDSKREWRLAKRADHADEWTLKFYDTKKDDIEGIEYAGQREEVVFDAPVTRVVPWEQVICPAGVANLQPQSRSNPKGAPWVAIRDYPRKEEILRLAKSGTYNLLDEDDLEKILNQPVSRQDRELEDQEHTMQGTEPTAATPKDKKLQELTRLMVFDEHDMDGNGKVEGVIYTVLLEPELLCRAEPLTERYRVPEGGKPWRPLADGPFLPARGRREGMGLPDLMEGLHDTIKELFDTAMNTDVIQTTVTGAYKPSSNMPLETLAVAPGDLIPLDDPKNDLVYRPVPSSSSAFSLNAISLLFGLEEKMTLLGDLQRGRVPAGKATALRTSSGIQTILQQGQARPDRIFRRWYNVLRQVWEHHHWLNLMHLSDEKLILVSGASEPDASAYRQIGRADIQGVYKFGFGANASNAARGAKAELLQNVLTAQLNPVFLQMGIFNADTAYRATRDWLTALGADPDLYSAKPTPTSGLDPITAEEVLDGLLQNPIIAPVGSPAEGASAHLEKISALIREPIFDALDGSGDKVSFMERASEGAKAVLVAYLQGLAPAIAQEREAAALQQAAQGAAPALGPGEPQAGAPPDTGQAPLQENELAQEDLPGNGRPL